MNAIPVSTAFESATLLVDSNYGIYTAQKLAQYIDLNNLSTSICKEDMDILLEGPDNECYGETWLFLDGETFTGLDGVLYSVVDNEGHIWAMPTELYEAMDWDLED